MDNIPKELEETQLNLEIVIDPTTKCCTMKTQVDKTSPNSNDLASEDIIPIDPLHSRPHVETVDDIDLSKMNELEKLIYSERERILNLRKPKKYVKNSPDGCFITYESSQQPTDSDNSSEAETREGLCKELSQNEKSRLRMRKRRERETSEERDYRRFRQRIVTMKIRLMQKINNFDNETYLKELTKKHTAKIKQKRREIKEKETPEQRALRKSVLNVKSRLRNMRRKAFRTAEELAIEKERRLSTLEKYWARYTDEERRARQKLHRDKARERYRKNTEELKKFDRFLKGAPLEILEKPDEK